MPAQLAGFISTDLGNGSVSRRRFSPLALLNREPMSGSFADDEIKPYRTSWPTRPVSGL